MDITATWPIGQIRRTSAAFLAALLLFTGLTATPGAAQETGRFVTVILQGFKLGAAHDAVKSVEGRVTQEFPIINGVSARVRTTDIDELRQMPGILNVQRDTKVEFQGKPDYRVPQRIQKVVRADKLWSQGITGAGATVALIDTGVYADHPDLAGRVTHCEDLTHERNTEAHCADTFGHGTFMAGLIAGNGTASGGVYKGAAPEAEIVSVKVAGFDGSADVTNILAGIQWAVANKDVYGIDVMSLSVGTDSTVGTRLSPLSFAVERAWAAGIAVVVSAGNRGPETGTVTSPADNPYVITVGASNDQGTSSSINDDVVPVFSGRGPTAEGLAKPDVVSPGVSTVSLRSPGSYIDQNFGSTASVGDHYFKGTGTSMATATVAGAVAQILQHNPRLTPDQIKYRLMDTARPIATTDPNLAGEGLIDSYAAATSPSTGLANVGLTPSTGLGSIDAARGSLDVWVETPGGSVALDGEITAQTNPEAIDPTNPLGLIAYDPVTFTSTGWDGSKWSGSKWSTDEWAGSKWSGAEFQATTWDGSKWSGSKWSNADWDGSKWSNIDWDGSKWSGSKWSTAWYAAAWD